MEDLLFATLFGRSRPSKLPITGVAKGAGAFIRKHSLLSRNGLEPEDELWRELYCMEKPRLIPPPPVNNPLLSSTVNEQARSAMQAPASMNGGDANGGDRSRQQSQWHEEENFEVTLEDYIDHPNLMTERSRQQTTPGSAPSHSGAGRGMAGAQRPGGVGGRGGGRGGAYGQGQFQDPGAPVAFTPPPGMEVVFPSEYGPGKAIKLPRQTRVQPEEYKEFLALGHGDIFDIDLDRVTEAPWRLPLSSISDYFNYNMSERGWREYQTRVFQYRAEFEYRNKIEAMSSLGPKLAFDPPPASIPPNVFEAIKAEVIKQQQRSTVPPDPLQPIYLWFQDPQYTYSYLQQQQQQQQPLFRRNVIRMDTDAVVDLAGDDDEPPPTLINTDYGPTSHDPSSMAKSLLSKEKEAKERERTLLAMQEDEISKRNQRIKRRRERIERGESAEEEDQSLERASQRIKHEHTHPMDMPSIAAPPFVPPPPPPPPPPPRR